jgi:hypothetical protein
MRLPPDWAWPDGASMTPVIPQHTKVAERTHRHRPASVNRPPVPLKTLFEALAKGQRQPLRWTSKFPDPEGRESATPFSCGHVMSLPRDMEHQAVAPYHTYFEFFMDSLECVTRPPRARTEIKSGSSRSLNTWHVSQAVSTRRRSSISRSSISRRSNSSCVELSS